MELKENTRSLLSIHNRLIQRRNEIKSEIEVATRLNDSSRIPATYELENLENYLAVIRTRLNVAGINENNMVMNLSVTSLYSDDKGDVIVLKNKDGLTFTLESVETATDGFGVDKMDVSDLDMSDFAWMLFDFKLDDLGCTIERVKGSGIRLRPNNALPVFIPCRNGNGWYGDKTILVLKDIFGNELGKLDITECLQEVAEETE